MAIAEPPRPEPNVRLYANAVLARYAYFDDRGKLTPQIKRANLTEFGFANNTTITQLRRLAS